MFSPRGRAADFACGAGAVPACGRAPISPSACHLHTRTHAENKSQVGGGARAGQPPPLTDALGVSDASASRRQPSVVMTWACSSEHREKNSTSRPALRFVPSLCPPDLLGRARPHVFYYSLRSIRFHIRFVVQYKYWLPSSAVSPELTPGLPLVPLSPLRRRRLLGR